MINFKSQNEIGSKVVNKKQIFIPIIILTVGIVAAGIFFTMKEPPKEKEKVDNTPIVAISVISVKPLTFEVASHGMVTPKYETQLIAQVNGEIVELSEAFVKGGFVNKNQLLARIDPSDYQAALIDAQAAMATAKAALETEVAQGKVAKRDWKAITKTSPTELSLRKPQLAKELASVKAAQASILRAERNLERTEIRAPYDAMIDSRDIGLGSFVGTGTKIGHLLATNTAKVRLPVADNQLTYLRNNGVGSQVKLIGTYAGKATQWNANIIRSEGVVDNKSRMNYLVAELDDPYQLKTAADKAKAPLRFGSYVKASIVGNEIPSASIIPRHLVINNKVALLDSESTLHYVKVDIARQQGSHVIVVNGLADGDQLITSALDYPINGMKLALAEDLLEQDDSGEASEIASINEPGE